MTNSINRIIAVDAMGGDGAPRVPVHGALLALERDPELHIHLYGDEAQIVPLINDVSGDVRQRLHLEHCLEVVLATDKPSSAIRKSQESSMNCAIVMVKDDQAAAAVSAGNTGALMALSLFALRTINGVERPALGRAIPSMHGTTCILDLGANVHCSANHLVQYSMMGAAFAECVCNIKNPRVALMNIGTEVTKGLPEIREADGILQHTHLNYIGYIESNDLITGKTDVIVCDGFSGNLVLKCAEGVFHVLREVLRESLNQSLFGKILGLLTRRSLRTGMRRFDPTSLEGAALLGLTKTVVKAHGGTSPEGFANAIKIARDMTQRQLQQTIGAHMQRLVDMPPIDTAKTAQR